MRQRQVHLELLVGTKVRDASGKCAGRIREVRTHHEGEECLVDEYLIGGGGLMESLSVAGFSTSVIHLLGGRGHGPSRRVRWDQMDLSDPKRPRLRVRCEELDEL